MQAKSHRLSISLIVLAAIAAVVVLLAGTLAASAAEQAAPTQAPTDVELLINGDFSAGLEPWWTTPSISTTTDENGLSAEITDGGENPWDAIGVQHDVRIQDGGTYTVSFTASAESDISIALVIQENGGAYVQYFGTEVELTSTPQDFEFTFEGQTDDPAATFQFHMGGGGETTVNLANVSLMGPEPVETVEALQNSDFSNGFTSWWATDSVGAMVEDGLLTAQVNLGGTNPWDAIVGQHNVTVVGGGNYKLSVTASADTPTTINVILQENGDDYTSYFSSPIDLTTEMQTFEFEFEVPADDPEATFQFHLGGQGQFTATFDTVSLMGPPPPPPMVIDEILNNGSFDDGFEPWWSSDSVTPDTSAGYLAAQINTPGENPWDAIVGQHNISVMADETYTLTLKAWASESFSLPIVLQENGGSYALYFGETLALTDEMQEFEFVFTGSATDPEATFQFHMGGQSAATVYLDDVSLLGPVPVDGEEQLPAIRVNQTGYLPDAPKMASVVSEATTPQPWSLLDGDGATVMEGMTSVFGDDAASGDYLHQIDFSAFSAEGQNYTLAVGDEISHAFDISAELLDELKYDALAYFYHNRSGIAIEMPYAGSDEYTREAGHVGVEPNQGDTAVTCFDGLDSLGVQWQGCDYTLDVTGGWYDAGDHGRYVVNGGISTWTLFNLYERFAHVDGADMSLLADGSMNIPENSNGVPDILDEARWNMEFMMKMQVPEGGMVEGVLREGMVHHKVHDENWTALGLAPADDPQPRFLYPPSTAATLNMAATAAQCARIFADYDADFAAECLTSAETAWEAAIANPEVYAADNFTGGGPYNDTDVTDEFYWAAAELYITTGKQVYADYIADSPHYLASGEMTWGATAMLGTISLALVPSDLPAEVSAEAQGNIRETALEILAIQEEEGYQTAYGGLPDGTYPWGSNSFVVNNMITLGLAYDFTQQAAFLNGISHALDYLMGRNAMDQSYVSGYGERPLMNPHHRFWANQLNDAFPAPPPGAFSGGPNSGMEDPYVQTVIDECAPQKCFVDHIESWSTNEITINWNAPFAWTVMVLDDSSEFAGTYTSYVPALAP